MYFSSLHTFIKLKFHNKILYCPILKRNVQCALSWDNTRTVQRECGVFKHPWFCFDCSAWPFNLVGRVFWICSLIPRHRLLHTASKWHSAIRALSALLLSSQEVRCVTLMQIMIACYKRNHQIQRLMHAIVGLHVKIK